MFAMLVMIVFWNWQESHSDGLSVVHDFQLCLQMECWMLALEVPRLKEQLEDSLEKRFGRPSVLHWITPGLLVTKRMDD